MTGLTMMAWTVLAGMMDSWTWSWSWSWKTDQHLPGLAVALGVVVPGLAVAAVGGARLQRPSAQAQGRHRCFLGLLQRALV